MVKMLLEKGADPLQIDAHSRSLLHVASEHGTPRVASAVLKLSCDGNARDQNNQTPLHLAYYSRSNMLIRTLARNGAVINAARRDGSTPLHKLFRDQFGSSRIESSTKVLLEHGAYVHART
jgi:ankyrin repeat protein